MKIKVIKQLAKRLISFFLPNAIKRTIIRLIIKHKYDVKFLSGAGCNLNSYFEGKNVIGQDSRVYNSYLGLCSYVASETKINFTKVGRFCAIGDHVRTYLGIHPTSRFVSIHPVFYSLLKQIGFTFTDKQRFLEHTFILPENRYVVEIGNDVWIGSNVLIVDGVKIGDGAIITAGSVVTRDLPPYAIAGGIPARVLKYRFNKKYIRFLLNFKWWDKDFEWIRENCHLFDDIDLFMKKYNSSL